MRYALAVERMPTDEVPPLETEKTQRIISLALSSTRSSSQSTEIRRLLQEVPTDHAARARSLTQVSTDHAARTRTLT